MGPAKAALEATARHLAYELGSDGIRVNCISPGPMNTVSARGIPGISVRLVLFRVFYCSFLSPICIVTTYLTLENEELRGRTCTFEEENFRKRSGRRRSFSCE